MPARVEGLVSVIVPTFNRATMLSSVVESVAAQTYRPLELIIVNDGSTDATGRVSEELAAMHEGLISVVHRENGGAGGARETGRQVARGEFIQYLDSDDWIAPRKIERQVAAFRANPDADLCYCRTQELIEGRAEGCGTRPVSDEVLTSIFPQFLSGRLWHTIAPLYRASLTDRMGPWTDLRQEEDLEYDARAGAVGARLIYVPETLAEHRHHFGFRAGGGSTQDTERMRCRFESHRLVLGHARNAGVTFSNPHMQSYARELFHLARLCGAVGLAREARELFDLAREASGPDRSRALDFRAYRMLAAVAGWRAVGKVSCLFDSVRAR